MPEFNTRLVGANFRPVECQAMVSDLDIGDYVQLIRDPENAFDPDAIKIVVSEGGEEFHLGFVAAKSKDAIALASEIAPFMDLDTYYEAIVVADAGTKFPAIHFEIFEDDEAA